MVGLFRPLGLFLINQPSGMQMLTGQMQRWGSVSFPRPPAGFPPFSHSLSSPGSGSLAAGHPLAQLTEVGRLLPEFSKLLAGQFSEP